MKVLLAAAAVLFALLAPAAARADVTYIGGVQTAAQGVSGAGVTLPTAPQNPDQTWVAIVSTSEAATTTSVTYRGQAFTQRAVRSGAGTRTEFWTLSAPDLTLPAGSLQFTFSTATNVRLGLFYVAGVHRTNPFILGAGISSTGTATSGSLGFGTITRPEDLLFGTITGADATLPGLSPAAFTDGIPPTTIYGNETSGAADDGPLRVQGVRRRGGAAAGFAWTWSAPTPAAPSPYTIAAFGIRAPDLATVTASNATAVTKTSATLGGNVTTDGSGTVTSRGVVYCAGCGTPAIGGGNVTRVDAAAGGTGAFTVGASGLTEATLYTVRAFAISTGGVAYSAPITFTTVANAPPTNVSITPANQTISEGDSLTLAASATDVDGDTLTYSWDLNNDGTYGDATGANPTMTWAQLAALGLDGPQAAPVRVRVSDGHGHAVTSAPAAVSILNVAPIAVIGGPSAVPEGSTANISIGPPTDPSAADLAAGIRYGYDFDNDGSWEIGSASYATASTQRGFTVPASYLDDGDSTRTIRIVLIDRNEGLRFSTFPIDVRNVAPTPNPSTFGGQEGATIPVGYGSPGSQGVTEPSTADRAALRYGYDFNNDGTWDLGSNSYATAVAQNTANMPAALVDNGPATPRIRLAVVDKDGGVTITAYDVTVVNVAPTIGTNPAVGAPEGQTGTVTLFAPLDPSAGDTAAGIRFQYDLDGDNTYEIGGTTYATAVTALTQTVPAALNADGPSQRTIHVAAIDRDGDRRIYNVTFTVTNNAPTAAAPNVSVDEGATATIGLTNLADVAADLPSLRFAYDFQRDGTYDVGSRTYAQAATAATADLPAALTADGPATRPVRLAVVDKDGGSNPYDATVTVRNVAPTAKLADVTTPEGTPAKLEFTDADDVSAADKAAGFTYEWDVNGDGTFTPGGASVDVPTPDGPATLAVTGAIIDRDGGRREYTATVRTENVAPTATLADAATVEGTPARLTFTGAGDQSAADQAAGFTYEWDADGDGTFIPGPASIDVAAPDGPATIEVPGAILDRDGGRTEYTAKVTVANSAPTAAIAGPDAVGASGATTLTLQLADSGADTVSSVLNWGDGTTEDVTGTGEKTVTHTYATPGAKEITLVATDSDGAASAVATHTLTVATAAPAPAPAPAPTVVAQSVPKQTLSGLAITPRCIRANAVRAVIAKTVIVRFSLALTGEVTVKLERWKDKPGQAKCPPLQGYAPAGQRPRGSYSPFTAKTLAGETGRNTVTLATTGKGGKRLRPGTYLLTVSAGGSTARVKLWVLDQN